VNDYYGVAISKRQRARFAAGLSLSLATNARQAFQNQRLETRIVFCGIHGSASMRNGPADEQGRFPGSSLLSTAPASKDQGGSPDDASRLFVLGSIRTSGQTRGPTHDHDRGRGHP
jgi:hypothetical protein